MSRHDRRTSGAGAGAGAAPSDEDEDAVISVVMDWRHERRASGSLPGSATGSGADGRRRSGGGSFAGGGALSGLFVSANVGPTSPVGASTGGGGGVIWRGGVWPPPNRPLLSAPWLLAGGFGASAGATAGAVGTAVVRSPVSLLRYEKSPGRERLATFSQPAGIAPAGLASGGGGCGAPVLKGGSVAGVAGPDADGVDAGAVGTTVVRSPVRVLRYENSPGRDRLATFSQPTGSAPAGLVSGGGGGARLVEGSVTGAAGPDAGCFDAGAVGTAVVRSPVSLLRYENSPGRERLSTFSQPGGSWPAVAVDDVCGGGGDGRPLLSRPAQLSGFGVRLEGAAAEDGGAAAGSSAFCQRPPPSSQDMRPIKSFATCPAARIRKRSDVLVVTEYILYLQVSCSMRRCCLGFSRSPLGSPPSAEHAIGRATTARRGRRVGHNHGHRTDIELT